MEVYRICCHQGMRRISRNRICSRRFKAVLPTNKPCCI
ncbi:hypothetical protein DQQ10_23860 [Pseudochryseolinea flava]|uniref:Anaphylatoxin-like domain-containing protein n=1 Tax=Pseudochryseolinea flava TaxID=2059302 RepID=A0A364XY69_9BACT|nr:hypothetical protein DQQ10_23860 [Pseudochryseolinea flava]